MLHKWTMIRTIEHENLWASFTSSTCKIHTNKSFKSLQEYPFGPSSLFKTSSFAIQQEARSTTQKLFDTINEIFTKHTLAKTISRSRVAAIESNFLIVFSVKSNPLSSWCWHKSILRYTNFSVLILFCTKRPFFLMFLYNIQRYEHGTTKKKPCSKEKTNLRLLNCWESFWSARRRFEIEGENR